MAAEVLPSRTRRTNNRFAAHLRLIEVTVGRTNAALGALYGRLALCIGKAKAGPRDVDGAQDRGVLGSAFLWPFAVQTLAMQLAVEAL